MALQLSDLSVLAYANNFTLWHYKTSDENIDSLGYFNNASDMMRANDLIIANVYTEHNPKTQFFIVTKSEDKTVEVAIYK